MTISKIRAGVHRLLYRLFYIRGFKLKTSQFILFILIRLYNTKLCHDWPIKSIVKIASLAIRWLPLFNIQMTENIVEENKNKRRSWAWFFKWSEDLETTELHSKYNKNTLDFSFLHILYRCLQHINSYNDLEASFLNTSFLWRETLNERICQTGEVKVAFGQSCSPRLTYIYTR